MRKVVKMYGFRTGRGWREKLLKENVNIKMDLSLIEKKFINNMQ